MKLAAFSRGITTRLSVLFIIRFAAGLFLFFLPLCVYRWIDFPAVDAPPSLARFVYAGLTALLCFVLLVCRLYWRNLASVYRYQLLTKLRCEVTESAKSARFRRLFRFGRSEAAGCLASASEHAAELSPAALFSFFCHLLLALAALIFLFAFDAGFAVIAAVASFFSAMFFEMLRGEEPSRTDLLLRFLQLSKLEPARAQESGFSQGAWPDDVYRSAMEACDRSSGEPDPQVLRAWFSAVLVVLLWSVPIGLFLFRDAAQAEGVKAERVLLGLFSVVYLGSFHRIWSFCFKYGVRRSALDRLFIVIESRREPLPAASLAGGSFPALCFKNAGFSYSGVEAENGGRDILEKLSFTIRKGDICTFSVPDPAKKTVLLHLLLGHIKPTSGLITVDGVDVNEFDSSSLRSCIDVITPACRLEKGDVESVLTSGAGAVSEERYHAVLVITGVADFLPYLPEAEATQLDSPEVVLSEGHKARILLARALLRRSPLVVFDYVFEKLDEGSRAAILRALETTRKEHAVCILTQETAPPEGADSFFVLKDNTFVKEK